MGKRKGKRGRAARNARKSAANEEPEELVKAPHSFVIRRGRIGKKANELLVNFRKVMEPFTAADLKVSRQNVLKDFVHIAGPLNVTHLVVFTKSEIAMYMRIIRLPRGPTLTFKINEYCLARDVVSSSKKTIMYEKLFSHHPLLILNGFSGEGLHFKLMTSMLRGMFPSININKTNLNTIRRTLLFNYNQDKTIDMRHYAIKIIPTGISKAAKKLIQSKVPDLGNYGDMSEFMMKAGNLSESEAEMDNALNQVVLPQPISSRGNITSQKSAIRLYELGPRLTLQLIKIEEGIVSGDVLFHEFIAKTPREVEAIKARKKRLMQLKAKRRAQQEQNVLRKKEEKEKSKSKAKNENVEENESEDDNDEEWYRKEVGQEPDKDLMLHGKRKNRNKSVSRIPKKRVRFADGQSSEKESKKEEKTLQNMIAHRKKRKLAKLRKQRMKRKVVRKMSKGKKKH